VIIGAGNIGQAVANYRNFEKLGVQIIPILILFFIRKPSSSSISNISISFIFSPISFGFLSNKP
jgi:NADH/NAD ratio-sensing transcriptional regulator Rex